MHAVEWCWNIDNRSSGRLCKRLRAGSDVCDDDDERVPTHPQCTRVTVALKTGAECLSWTAGLPSGRLAAVHREKTSLLRTEGRSPRM